MINHDCLICLGSNFESEIHLEDARKSLKDLFPTIVFGESILMEAEGNLPQPAYVNQAASFQTSRTKESVNALLKQIEVENGRTPASKYIGRIPLDIDLLSYDQLILKPSDWSKEYVKKAVERLPKR